MKAKSVFEFVRGVDPPKSLGLGYEAKIRALFRYFGVPDEKYEVKEDGKIVFNNILNLSNTADITELPDNLTIDGDCYLYNSQLKFLPNNFTVLGNLNIENTKLKELPNNLIIKGVLAASQTQIHELPDDLKIGSCIYVSRNNVKLINWIQQSKFKNKLKRTW